MLGRYAGSVPKDRSARSEIRTDLSRREALAVKRGSFRVMLFQERAFPRVNL
jgi:hypothetical protein